MGSTGAGHPAGGPTVLRPDRKASVAVEAMPLADFVHHLFAEVFQVNYVVDADVQNLRKPVTLNVKEPMPETDLYRLARGMLAREGVAVAEKSGTFFVYSQGVGGVQIGVGRDAADVPAGDQVRQIVPLAYLDAGANATFVASVAGTNVTLDSRDNAFLITGPRVQVLKTLEMIRILDRPAMRGRYVGLLPVEHWTPAEMKQKLTEVLGEEGIPISPSQGKPGLWLTAAGRQSALIAFASEEAWLERARYWVDVLNRPAPGEQEQRQYFLYFPQNSRAADLGASLSKLTPRPFGEPRGGRESTSATDTARSAPKPAPGSPTAPATPAAPKAQARAAEWSAGGGDFDLVVDENRNALIFFTTADRYAELHGLLVKLDTMPPQVLIEATIGEVTLSGDLSLGLEWFLRGRSGGLTQVFQTLGGLGIGSGGFSYSAVANSGDFQALIQALAQEDQVRILSSPRLTVRDGKAASINVGTDVPVITSEATTADFQVQGSSGFARTIQYRNTGVTLQVTPSVHAQGVVALKLSAQVSEAQINTTSDISSPIILNRSMDTEVVARDGQTVILGGLISSNKSDGVSKVPLLGDLPVVGSLFRTESKSNRQTELVMLLTPHILTTPADTDALRDSILGQFRLIQATESQGRVEVE